MSTIITDNPYTFTVADNMNINAVFEDDARIIITTSGSDSVRLVNSSNQTYLWNLRSGENIYDGSVSGFAINEITGIYKYNSSTSERDKILNSIDISKCTNLTSIPGQAFRDCYKLSSFIFPPTLTTIENHAFSFSSASGGEGLTSITFPSTLTTIGRYAFEGNRLLTTVDLSNTQITSIDTYTFFYCTGLQYIIFPPTLTSISDNAFRDVGMNIVSLTCLAITPPTVSNTYGLPDSSFNPNYPIYVPAGSVSAYKAARGWPSNDRIQAIP